METGIKWEDSLKEDKDVCVGVGKRMVSVLKNICVKLILF